MFERMSLKMTNSARPGQAWLQRIPRCFRFVWLVAALFGCSLRVDANRVQCNQDSDCAARGAAFTGSVCKQNFCQSDEKWSCIGQAPPSIQAGTYRQTLHVRDVLGSAPLAGVTAQLCRKLDLTCEKPISTTASDEKGTFSLIVESNFDGYVQLT